MLQQHEVGRTGGQQKGWDKSLAPGEVDVSGSEVEKSLDLVFIPKAIVCLTMSHGF